MQIPLIKQKMKPTRILKVYSIKRTNSKRNLPWISLSGAWLMESNFKIGQSIKITVRKGQLTIEII